LDGRDHAFFFLFAEGYYDYLTQLVVFFLQANGKNALLAYFDFLTLKTYEGESKRTAIARNNQSKFSLCVGRGAQVGIAARYYGYSGKLAPEIIYYPAVHANALSQNPLRRQAQTYKPYGYQ
jgi:hypothetical protein